MAWLRLDDLFLEHPKIVNLTDAQLRVHLAVMLWSCRHYTLGRVSTGALRTLGVARPTTARLVALGLWETTDDGIEIHDFHIYNSLKIEEKVARYLLDNPEASANDVCSKVGGNRKLVLATIKKLRFPTGTKTEPEGGSPMVPDPVPGNQHARGRTRVSPSPSLESQTPPSLPSRSETTPRTGPPASAGEGGKEVEHERENGTDPFRPDLRNLEALRQLQEQIVKEMPR